MSETQDPKMTAQESEDFIKSAETFVLSLVQGIKELSEKSIAKKHNSIIQPFFITLLEACHEAMNIGIINNDEEGEMLVLKNLGLKAPPNAVVFDVGSSIGNYSAAVLKNFVNGVTLHAFEPTQTSYPKIKERFASNQNVHVHNVAVSDKCGEATMFSNAAGSELSSLHKRDLDRIGIPFEHKETVKVVTIDSFCSEKGIDKIYLLKLDVEGNELSALNGAKRMIEEDRIDFIQYEFGANLDSRTYQMDFFRLLEQKFVICRILRHEVFPILGYTEHNEIFRYSNFLAVSKRLLPPPAE